MTPFAGCIPALLLAGVAAFSAELLMLDGQKQKGDLVAISAQEVIFKSDDGEAKTPISKLLAIEIGPASESRDKYTEVELADGSVLFASSVAVKADRCEIKTLSGMLVSAPLAGVATILRDAHDAALRKEWLALLRKRGPLDMLVIRSDGKLDALEGTAGAGNDEGDAIDFTPAGGEKISTKLSRAQGFVFVRKPDPNVAPAICRVIDAAGNSLSAKAVRLDGEKVVVVSVSGATATFAALKSISRFDFSRGKLTYLSDLDPIEKDESSTEDLIFPYRRDRNLQGGPLRLKGAAYAKGLALHSRTVLTYDIGGDYREFRATVGVDDAVRGENGAPVRATLLIEADGRELFNGEIQSRDDPKPLALDIKNVRRLRITFASPGLDLGNQVNLCDARVTK